MKDAFDADISYRKETAKFSMGATFQGNRKDFSSAIYMTGHSLGQVLSEGPAQNPVQRFPDTLGIMHNA